jgi:hypothetical protein
VLEGFVLREAGAILKYRVQPYVPAYVTLLFGEICENLAEFGAVTISHEARETIGGYYVDMSFKCSFRKRTDNSEVLRLKAIQVSLEAGGQVHCIAVFPGMGERMSDSL